MQLKILSWNIWCDGDIKGVAEFIRTANADIIGLQEVLPNDKEFNIISFLANQLGYKYVYAKALDIQKDGGTTEMGNALFSKYEILDNKTHILSETESRVAVEASIKVNDTALHVFDTHLYHVHLNQSSPIPDQQIDNLISVLPKEKTIVMGDFNVTPESSVIKKISQVLKNTDPVLTPTWSNYPEGCEGCNPQGIDHRLDYIFVSEDLNVHSPKVENSQASDHLPISIIVEI